MKKQLRTLFLLKEASPSKTVRGGGRTGLRESWLGFVNRLPMTEVEETLDLSILNHEKNNQKIREATCFDIWSKRLKGAKPPPKPKPLELPKISTKENTEDGENEASQVEADAGSTNAAVLRSQESQSMVSEVRFLESLNPGQDIQNPSRFRVILIQEGMGNPKTAFYYSKDALYSAASLYEGKKVYADHPGRDEEETRPERSVRDVIGHYENVDVVLDSASMQHQVEADLVVLPGENYQWARDVLKHAVDFSKKHPEKEFIGLSINANGEAEPKSIDDIVGLAPQGARSKLMKAKEMGIKEIRYVSKIDDAVSCDLVTEAGAGGRVLAMLESDQKLQEGGPGSGRKAGGGKSRDEQRAIKRAAALTKSNLQHVAFKKKSDAIKKGISNAASNKKADAWAAHTAAAKKAAQMNQKQSNESEGSMDEKDKLKEAGAVEAAAPADQQQSQQDPGQLDPVAAAEAQDHADAEQDKALIQAELKKYLGGEEGSHSEEELALAQEAYQCYKEMGLEEAKAIEYASNAVKLAKHMSQKQAEADAAAADAEQVPGQDDQAPVEESEAQESEEAAVEESEEQAPPVQEAEKQPEQQKESEKVVALSGKVAMLEAEIAKRDFAEAKDKMLRESGLSRSMTKRFLDLEEVKECKTEKELQKLFKLFKEGNADSGGGEALKEYDFILSAEKTTTTKKGAQGISFEDCKN